MKGSTRTFLLILLAAHSSCRPADKIAEHRPIFRHYNNELSTIQLGQPWTAEEVPGSEPNDTVVGLPSSPADKAQAIRVHRTPGGIVSSIMFDYPPAADFSAMQKEYTDLFGQPARHDLPRRPDGAERIVWQDSLTTFELVRDPARSASSIYTRLLDRSISR
jgi:hypothetical protein